MIVDINKLYCDVQNLYALISALEKRVFNIETNCCAESFGGCLPVYIRTNPASQILNTGERLILFVQAGGTTPYTYQWMKDGEAIDGATNSTFVIPTVAPSDLGTYTVQITNECGMTVSEPASVAVSEQTQVYWGWVNDINLITSQDDIENLQFTDFFGSGEDIEADYRSNPNPQILVMAQLTDQPTKTKWYASPNNNGDIGGDTNFFADPIIIDAYEVYYTNYLSQQNQTTVIFKVN